VIEKLAPGASRIVESKTLILDGEAHDLVVRYRVNRGWGGAWAGTVASRAQRVAQAGLSVLLQAKGGAGTIEVEIEHRYHGPTQLRFLTGWAGVCAGPQDGLLLDGVARGFIEVPCDGPAAPLTEAVAPGGRFVTRGTIHVAPGYHRVRARYRVEQRTMQVFGIKGNIGDWTGDVESPEVDVMVR
jgi:hypothetical protein